MHMQSNPGSAEMRNAETASAWSQVAAFASAVDANLDKWLMERHRLGLTEYRALAHLVRAADRELRVNDLAQRVGLSQSSVTRLVSRLETKDLARRDTCPDDGRGVYAVLTEHGESLLADARGPYEEYVSALLGDVGAHFPQFDANRLGRALADVRAVVMPGD